MTSPSQGPVWSVEADQSFSIDTEDGGGAANGGEVQMLVAVDHERGTGSVEVGEEGFESLVHLPVAFMNASRRVVGDEHIRWGKGLEEGGDFRLFIQMVAAGFVFPTSAEPDEANSLKRLHGAMQIHDAIREWGVGIVVSPDGKHLARLVVIDGTLDGCIVQIAAGNENIDSPTRPLAEMGIVIRNRKDRHGGKIAARAGPVNDGCVDPAFRAAAEPQRSRFDKFQPRRSLDPPTQG